MELPGALPDPSSANTLALLAALGASPSLTALHLQQNLLGSLATQTLANALAERFDGRAALRVLDFSQNEPLLNSGSEDFHAFEALCGALVDHAPHLQTLNLGSCGLQRTRSYNESMAPVTKVMPALKNCFRNRSGNDATQKRRRVATRVLFSIRR